MLSYGVVSVILYLAVLLERQLVSDGRTDRQTDREIDGHSATAHTALA